MKKKQNIWLSVKRAKKTDQHSKILINLLQYY